LLPVGKEKPEPAVTGSRKDPWAAANPFEVEQEKPEEERGRYLDPSLYDAAEVQRVTIGPIGEGVEEEPRPPELSGIDFARLEEERLRQMMMQPPTRTSADSTAATIDDVIELRLRPPGRRAPTAARRIEAASRGMERQVEAPPEST
jgi:hypothetical protein